MIDGALVLELTNLGIGLLVAAAVLIAVLWVFPKLNRSPVLSGYVEGEALFVRSDAVLRIVAQLPGAWRWLAWPRILPRALRDWCYDRIALNRYRLFGRYDSCLLPDPDHQGRFLDSAEPRS